MRTTGLEGAAGVPDPGNSEDGLSEKNFILFIGIRLD